MGKACSTHWERLNACMNVVGKPVGRPRCRWQDNIEMDLWEVGWNGMEWIHWITVGSSGGLL